MSTDLFNLAMAYSNMTVSTSMSSILIYCTHWLLFNFISKAHLFEHRPLPKTYLQNPGHLYNYYYQ